MNTQLQKLDLMPFKPAISPESSLDNFDFASSVKNEAK